MLNNIFINENSLNKLSARSKQTDPTMALDQASSFAGALANQVSINQNNNSTSSSSTSTNNNQVSSQNSESNRNLSQQASTNNNANPSNNYNSDTNQNANQSNSNTVENTQSKTESQSNTANNSNNNDKQNSTAPSNTTKQQAQARAVNNINLSGNLTNNVENIEKSLNAQDVKNAALPENFQKIIANLQNRNSKPAINNETKANINNKSNIDSEKPSLLANHRSSENKNVNLHQTADTKTNSRLAINNTKSSQTINLNSRSDQDPIRFGARETVQSNDKAFITSQGQTKEFNNQNHLINNFENQTELDRQAHASNTASSNNPIFGLAVTNNTSVTSSNANLQQGIIPSHINNPQWGNDLSRQMTNMIRIAGNGTQTAELRLDPPELGPLRITINLNDGVVNAIFSSMHANVRSAIEQSLPQLQQQLQQEGLSLGQADVGQDNQDSQHAKNDNNNKGNTFLTQNQENTDSDINVVQSNDRHIDPNALLDTYA